MEKQTKQKELAGKRFSLYSEKSLSDDGETINYTIGADESTIELLKQFYVPTLPLVNESRNGFQFQRYKVKTVFMNSVSENNCTSSRLYPLLFSKDLIDTGKITFPCTSGTASKNCDYDLRNCRTVIQTALELANMDGQKKVITLVILDNDGKKESEEESD